MNGPTFSNHSLNFIIDFDINLTYRLRVTQNAQIFDRAHLLILSTVVMKKKCNMLLTKYIQCNSLYCITVTNNAKKRKMEEVISNEGVQTEIRRKKHKGRCGPCSHRW